MEKTRRNWLITGIIAVAMIFSCMLGFNLNNQVQTAYAIGGEPNAPATAEQVMFISQTIDEFNSLPTGVSFENGVLTIGTDYNRSEGSDSSHPANIIVNTSNDEKADLTVVINKNAFYCRIANPSGNLTIVANGTVDALEVVAGENLTIKGSGMFVNVSANSLMFNYNPDKYSAIYAGEKMTIEGSVNCWLNTLSYTKSALSAKSLEINTEGTVRLEATSSPESINYRAPIAFHSCGSANDLAGKLVVKQGELTLKKYYNSEATENNSKFGFVGYSTNNTGNVTASSFDTEYKTFTDYPHAINDGDGAYQRLIVKNRTVSFNKNGGTGDNVSYTYLPVGKEVTLPECTYTAPANKQFAGWQVGDETKQPGATFILLDGENDYVVNAVWENIPANALTGTVAISGTLKYGEVLTASVTGSNNTGIFIYQWQRNGANIAEATNSTHTLTAEDVGKIIKVVVTSSVETGSIYYQTTANVAKADGPVAPTGINATACTTADNNNGSISGITTAMEYKLSGASDWTNGTGATITGLNYGTYLVRLKETATHNAGEQATVVVNAYNAPTEYSITVNYGTASTNVATTGTTITLTANAPQEGYEFDKWTGDGVTFADQNNATTTFVMPAGNVTITATYKLIPVEPEPEVEPQPQPTGLSAGAIVGIVLGVIVVGGIGGFALVWFVIKKKKWADFVALFKKK